MVLALRHECKGKPTLPSRRSRLLQGLRPISGVALGSVGRRVTVAEWDGIVAAGKSALAGVFEEVEVRLGEPLELLDDDGDQVQEEGPPA